MKPQRLRRLAQGVAVIFWGIGILILGLALYPFFVAVTFPWAHLGILGSLFFLVIGLALLRASFLVLFRWSPLAILHLTGAIFFFATLLVFPWVRLIVVAFSSMENAALDFLISHGRYVLSLAPQTAADNWHNGHPLVFLPELGFIVLMYVLYRITASRLSNRIFPKLTTQGPSPDPSHA